MTERQLPFRQVHLDFHTSEACGDVGRDFDPAIFAETVRTGHVNSMNVFARCHHGFSYYPTAVGTMHPGLDFDLLGAQIEALHAAGARAAIYVTLMWDDLAAEQHPGWVIARRDGSLLARPPLSGESQVAGGYSWSTLDLASGYGEYVRAQVEELCERYKPDGFWFDIAFAAPNYSAWGQAQARAAGIDLADDEAMAEFAYARVLAFMERLTAIVRAKAPDASIAYNHSTDGAMRDKVPFQSHLEIESLPTASHQWGYLHYPVVARHARSQGLPFVGMTGRFHKSWADFGGLKNDDQLTYEIGTILSAGGRVSVGDQLHPTGVLDPAVYRLLGRVYARVEALEPWLANASPITDLAVLSTARRADRGQGIWTAVRGQGVDGAAQFCLETGLQFDIIDPLAVAPERYPVLIVPDGMPLHESAADAVQRHLDGGGRLILDGRAGLDPATGRSRIDGIPVEYLGDAPTIPSYVRPDPTLAGDRGLSTDYDYVLYDGAQLVQPTAGATGHGELRQAFFDRTWQHFTSHAQAPVGAVLGTPLAVVSEQVLYFAAPLFRGYLTDDYWVYRELLRSAIDAFLPERAVAVDGPGWLEVGVLQQAADASLDRPARRVLHLTTYQARRTASRGPHVDQAWPVADVGLHLPRTADANTKRVYLAPDLTELPFIETPAGINIRFSQLGIHTVVVVE
jgi:hypothetical protein